MSAVIFQQQTWPRCCKCQQPWGLWQQMERTLATVPRGRTLLLFGTPGFVDRDQAGWGAQTSLPPLQAGLTASPSPSPGADPACLPAVTSGASRVPPHCPRRDFSMSHPLRFQNRGDVALLAPMPVLLHGLSGSCTRSRAGELNVCPATTWRRCSAVAGWAHLHPATDRGCHTATSPALEGRVHRHITSPRHCRQNPYILLLTVTLVRHQVCPQAASQKWFAL